MMQGACFFAWSNMSRTRDAPTPTNISTKSEPEIVADHQDAFRDLAAEPLELARVLQEFDDLGNFGLGLVDARDVRKRYADLVLAEQARLALAKGHRPSTAAAALHLPHEVDPDTDQQQDRERADQQLPDEALLLRFGRPESHTFLFELADDAVVVRLGTHRVVLQRLPTAESNPLTLEFDDRDLPGCNAVLEFRILDLLRLPAADVRQALHDRQQDDDYDNEYKYVFGQIIHIRIPRGGNPGTGFLDRF
jgi:hypothetical protein